MDKETINIIHGRIKDYSKRMKTIGKSKIASSPKGKKALEVFNKLRGVNEKASSDELNTHANDLLDFENQYLLPLEKSAKENK